MWEHIRKRAYKQLVREHSTTIISAHWATVDRSWHKEWNWCAYANLHFRKKERKKNSIGEEWMVKHSPKILASKEKAGTTTRGGVSSTQHDVDPHVIFFPNASRSRINIIIGSSCLFDVNEWAWKWNTAACQYDRWLDTWKCSKTGAPLWLYVEKYMQWLTKRLRRYSVTDTLTDAALYHWQADIKHHW